MPSPEREVPCAARGASPRAWGPVKVGAPKSREALGRRRGHLVSVKLDLLQSVQTGVSHPLTRIPTPCGVFRRGLLWMEENYAPLACRKRAPRSDGAERFPAPPGNVACGRPGDPHPRAPSGTQARTQSGTQCGTQSGAQSGTHSGTQCGAQLGTQFGTSMGPAPQPPDFDKIRGPSGRPGVL